MHLAEFEETGGAEDFEGDAGLIDDEGPFAGFDAGGDAVGQGQDGGGEVAGAVLGEFGLTVAPLAEEDDQGDGQGGQDDAEGDDEGASGVGGAEQFGAGGVAAVVDAEGFFSVAELDVVVAVAAGVSGRFGHRRRLSGSAQALAEAGREGQAARWGIF